ncbi:MAG: M67 family metallopeptidase [Capsulimonadaceae bacterium]
MPLSLTTEQLDEIGVHGEETYPHECCGFLIGRATADRIEVVQIERAANTRDDSPNNRYAVDPKQLYAVDRAAHAEGLGVVGIYHSHPDVAAVPSEYDREHACPWYCYLIVSVRDGCAAEIRTWNMTPDGAGFDEDAIITRGE